MTQGQASLSTSRTAAELITDIGILIEEIQALYCLDAVPWVIGYSGGKDSTVTLQLVWNALAALSSEKRTKKVYVITTDTLVENPIVSHWVRKSLKQMSLAAQEQDLPIEPHLLTPNVKDTFWVNLMGKGYPAPRHGFRWCTERLKIHPTNHFIRNVIRVSGEAVLVLGTRKAESTNRAATMAKYEIGSVSELLQSDSNLSNSLRYSDTLPNAVIYSPIQEWRDDEVWMYLMQCENPWGKNNQDLFNMYRGATKDNECPLVVDTSTPSCGDSRFGCWVCTLVNKDRSMEAMIQNDEDKEWLEPLLNLRDELDVHPDRHRRDFRRLRGKVQLFERDNKGKKTVKNIPGPYVRKWRETWLRRVLSAQVEVRQNAPDEFQDINLITPEELSEIRRIWLEEKHEFDDSLPRIYKEVTGEIFKDIRLGADEKLIGSDEWEILEEICDDEMHLELMSRLLDTERQFKIKNRRLGIYEGLEKCFDTSSRSKDEAIANAHQKYELKTASEQGNIEAVIEKVEQLTQPEDNSKSDNQANWASMKFSDKS